MSNYINVLRRLERERRAPESIPAAPIPVPAPVVRHTEPPASPTIAEPTSVSTFVPPPLATPEPPAAPPRTVIPLPSTVPTPTPTIAAAVPTPTVVTPPVPAPVPVAAQPTVAPPVPACTPEGVVAHAPEARLHDTRRERAFATETHPGIATLLDNIRLIANGRDSRMVVFCGASTAEAVNVLATALAHHAERSGMRAFVAMLNRTAAGPAVVPIQGANDTALGIDLDGGATQPALAGWVEGLAPGSDLVIITGPPLATSIDAALLACACDGLVIVAESEVTERAALQIAAERARIAGCKTLGVVMHGTKDRMPGWLRRLIGERSE